MMNWREEDFATGQDTACEMGCGVFRFGPVLLDCEDELVDLMHGAGLTTGADEELIILSDVTGGLTVFAAGEGIEGYFLSDDGLEAPREHVEAFLKAVCPKGATVTLCAHAPRGASEVFYARSVVDLGDDMVLWGDHRETIDLSSGKALQGRINTTAPDQTTVELHPV